MQYINASNILYDEQYGFRENGSTQDTMVDLVENITNAIDSAGNWYQYVGSINQ